ncbi:MAG: AAA family ATPase [Pseudomonadota bacterium]
MRNGFQSIADRETVPIAASDVNARPHELFGLVSDVAKPDVALTIAVVDAESTGKSTLVKRLAERFETTYAHEWGRTISEAHPTLTVEDFDTIVSMQDGLIRTAQRLSSGLCFADTEAITTALFAPTYLGQEHPLSWQRAYTQDSTQYLLLDPEVPWVDDGTRVLDTDARMAFHNALLSSLKRLNKPFTIISGNLFEHREAQAIALIERLRR